MRYAILLTLFIALPVLAFGYTGEATNIYSWGHDTPLNRTPQQLAAPPAIKYSDTDRDVIEDEDGIWVLKNTAGLDFDYHYVLFFWNYKPAWDTIKFKWRVAVAGGAKVRLYYWDGNSWEYITENAGGTSPASLTTGVKNYYNGDNLILLAVGGTKPGDRHTKCDIGKLIQ
jgi:hypothetical protein